MAMLAGPRKKNRYNLTPRGKPLFEDNDRFGTKMLEKMGWSKGKGLGKLEDGNQEFVRLKYKSDEQGLGYQERDDQWTEHEKQFNGLLENLNGEKNSDLDDCEIIRPTFGVPIVSKSTKKLKDKISGQSLEEKSKTSKARVHYKKFTKGKDMSQYSEKDLANIFGKKTTPEDVNIYNQFQAFTVNGNDDGEKKTEETPAKDEKPVIPLGTQVINTGVSVNDYFKSKMAALKEKLGNRSSNPFDGNVRVINNVEVFVPSSKRKASVDEEQSATEECEAPRKKKKKSHEIEEVPAVVESSEPEKSQEENISKKKKKKSQKESTEKDVIEKTESLEIISEENNKEEVPKKKKKSKKLETESEPTANDENQPKAESLEIVSEVINEEEVPKKKKSKKMKPDIEPNADDQNQPKAESLEIDSEEEEVHKKKKKNKKKETKSELTADDENQPKAESQEIVSEVNNEKEVPKEKKKSKKLETESEPTADDENQPKAGSLEIVSEENNEEAASKKKKSKKKEVESEPTVDDNNPLETEPLEIVSEENNEEEVPKEKKKSAQKETKSGPTADDKNQPECNSKKLTPVKKKKSKKLSSEEAVETANVQTEEEIPKKKKKDKKDSVSGESASKENHHIELPIPEQETNCKQEEEEHQQQQTKLTSKSKSKQKMPKIAEVSPQQPILDSTYTISTFCAEKFRVIEIHRFKDSNLSNIPGYGLNANLKLDIKENSRDIERITKLWNGTIDKYTHANAKNKVYRNFMDKVKMAQRNQCKIPQFKLRNLKRKQVFQCV